jgi:hypothetical protein
MSAKLQFFRNKLKEIQKIRRGVDFFGVALIVGLFFHYMPMAVFNAEPATGGDTGSHFWPLWTLVHEALPHFQIRVWNPGNLAGEPHLTHYFPLPYLLMAFFSLFMPLGRAFNIGTLLPVLLLPLCIYFCFKKLRTRFPVPILAALGSLSFLYNESFSMWGGNAVSTLAGQFAHMYAFCFFFLGIGFLSQEMHQKKSVCYLLAAFSFAAVLLSHFYVALMLPVVFLVFLILEKSDFFLLRFKKLMVTGLVALGLSAWFVLPMLHNSPWTTPFGLVWGRATLFQEAFPAIFWPFAILFVSLVLILSIHRARFVESEWKVPLVFCLLTAICSLLFYFIFPSLGLVDVRMVPNLELMLCLGASILIGVAARRFLSSPWQIFAVVLFSIVLIWWPARQVKNFPYWMQWNYSGWQAKTAYKDLVNVSDKLRGNFSEPRVIYENSDLSNAAGTMRVFEMLPFFAQRSTLESVYMQATLLAPAAFYMQALISKTPSCPFPNYTCTGFDLAKVENYASLLGFNQLLLITPVIRKQADEQSFLEKEGDFGLWHLYKFKEPVRMVETLSKLPTWVPMDDFKSIFYQWFQLYQPGETFLYTSPEDLKLSDDIIAQGQCNPNVEVTFNHIYLATDCPGKLHLLKFAYHSTWESTGNEKIYLLSPGYIGIVPQEKETVLTWGKHWLWVASDILSWLIFCVCLYFLILPMVKRSKT